VVPQLLYEKEGRAMAPSINLKTAIPGPKSKEVVARREAAVPSGLYKAHPIAIESAKGALVTDVDGNTYIDFVGGIGVPKPSKTPSISPSTPPVELRSSRSREATMDVR